jgi:hypothetical protein
MGTDPETEEARTLQSGDEVSLVMRNPDEEGAAKVRDVEILDMGANLCKWKPEDGDFTAAGDYQTVFDVTDSNGDVETIPDDEANDYVFHITAKPT